MQDIAGDRSKQYVADLTSPFMSANDQEIEAVPFGNLGDHHLGSAEFQHGLRFETGIDKRGTVFVKQ